MVMYPRRMALRRVVLEGPMEREIYVANAASLRLEIGGVVGLMEKAEISGTSVKDKKERAHKRVLLPLDK
jgi:hypothetical protein